MPTIGLIAATRQESDAVLRHIMSWDRFAPGLSGGKRFALAGQTCLLVTSGMGVRRAGEAARNLIEKHAAQTLVSFGIAGAVEADLRIGDVIAVEAVCRLEQGIPGPRLPLAAWPETSREAASQALSKCGARLLPGTAVTTGGAQVINYRPGELMHPILEMETAAIAQAAIENGVPLFSLRAISDCPSESIPFNLGEIMDENANPRAGRLLMTIARNPRTVFQFGRFARNTRIAASSAAIALMAALSQLSSTLDV